MAHNLGLEVIAEGVETIEQLEFLRKNGCKAFQGHLFGKAISQKEFNQLVPSILITGDTTPERIKEARISGFQLLHKPLQAARLRLVMAKLFGCTTGKAAGGGALTSCCGMPR